MKILICFGTRPEAIKMAPVCHELDRRKIDYQICVTAQHREMLDQVMEFFDLEANYDLDIMKDSGSLNDLTSLITHRIDKVLNEFKPDVVLIQGDTTTAMAVALASFNRKIKIGHIEAGLRTNNKYSPYPEEINRQLISRLADYHFAPTDETLQNLIEEGIDRSSVLKTGNTVIDSLQSGLNKLELNAYSPEIKKISSKINAQKRLILVTGHRRENFGIGLEQICLALLELAGKGFQIIYPVHLNPEVKEPVYKILGEEPNIHLVQPLDYPEFIWLMNRSNLIISDSGGVQEEAPYLGKKVVVTRENTERKESLEKGFAFLVGNNKDLIVNTCLKILEQEIPEFSSKIYGDGKASKRIVNFLIDQKV